MVMKFKTVKKLVVEQFDQFMSDLLADEQYISEEYTDEQQRELKESLKEIRRVEDLDQLQIILCRCGVDDPGSFILGCIID